LVDNSINFNIKNSNIPTAGGLCFILSYLIFFLFLLSLKEGFVDFPNRFFITNTFIFLVVLLSFWDDLKNIHPGIRLPLQFLFISFSLPMVAISEIVIPYNLLLIIVIIYWVYILNVINFIDGVDGFLSTYSLFFFLSSLLYSLIVVESFFLKLLSIFFIILTSVFLLFNKPKAKIFMGDSGSMQIGFIIGVISLLGYKSAAFATVFIPIIILIIPFMDGFSAIIRRKKNGNKIHVADKMHIHHVILEHSSSHKNAVLKMYIMFISVSISSLIYYVNKLTGTILMISSIIFIVNMFWRLGVFNGKKSDSNKKQR
jgi:UDP-GlcNAc:undecaprenyl-phosphate GlcNAc-1-phosphate transferase